MTPHDLERIADVIYRKRLLARTHPALTAPQRTAATVQTDCVAEALAAEFIRGVDGSDAYFLRQCGVTSPLFKAGDRVWHEDDNVYGTVMHASRRSLCAGVRWDGGRELVYLEDRLQPAPARPARPDVPPSQRGFTPVPGGRKRNILPEPE